MFHINRGHEDIDMLNGPLLGKMIKTAIPIILTNILQVFYNSADMFVLGNFCPNPNAIGAVGCTGALINLILGLFIGLGAGACVVLAQSIGSGNKEEISKTVHTSILLSVILGVIVGVLGFIFSPEMLVMMKTTDEFLKDATLYIQIYFCGSVANILYNFCAGMLRSRGDTVRPLIFSMIGGAVNIVLNLISVIFLNMGVEGVAIATIASQFISAVLIVIHFMRFNDDCRLDLKKLSIDKAVLGKLFKIGLPAGIQGMLFSMSNVILQSSYNKLGALYVNANTAASNVDVYIYNVLNSFHHVALSFASQNYGAKKADRIKKVQRISYACVTVIGVALGVAAIVFSDPLIAIFDSHADVIKVARTRLYIMAGTYFTCGLMDVGTAMLRAIGYSMQSTVIVLVGSCLLRVVWVYTVFAAHSDIFILYIVYPISWVVTTFAQYVVFCILFKKQTKGWELKTV